MQVLQCFQCMCPWRSQVLQGFSMRLFLQCFPCVYPQRSRVLQHFQCNYPQISQVLQFFWMHPTREFRVLQCFQGTNPQFGAFWVYLNGEPNTFFGAKFSTFQQRRFGTTFLGMSTILCHSSKPPFCKNKLCALKRADLFIQILPQLVARPCPFHNTKPKFPQKGGPQSTSTSSSDASCWPKNRWFGSSKPFQTRRLAAQTACKNDRPF